MMIISSIATCSLRALARADMSLITPRRDDHRSVALPDRFEASSHPGE
jgi:hypothetical protein